MNKAIQKMVMALAVCGALCGTTMAAPKGNPPPNGKAPTAIKASAQKPPAAKAHAPVAHTSKAPAPDKHTPQTVKAPGRAPTGAHPAPMRPAPRH